MGAGSFTSRLLRATLILPQGNFPGTNSNTLIVGPQGTGSDSSANPTSSFRMAAKLTQAGNFTNFASIDIWGLRQVDMQALSVVFTTDGGSSDVPTGINARAVVILEANSGAGWLQVFEGNFQQAQANYSSMPDVYLHIEAATGAGQQYLAAAPSSFQGGVEVAGLAQQLATQMGFAFENNGVTGTLTSPYLAGTLMDQFRDVCEHAGVDYYFDAKSTLIICPKNTPRQNRPVEVISPSSGLIGYVTIQQYGISLKSLFSPSRELGSPFELQDSDVPGTNGLWFPMAATHNLEALKPGGAWFSDLQCSPAPASQPT